MKQSAWLHACLTLYLWLVECVPLGNWNRQRDERVLVSVLHGHGVDGGEIGTLVFVALPSILFFYGYIQQRTWPVIAALVLDAFWLWMQIQSWWIPYIFGTTVQWQIAYSKGPTTKVLPSFGNHIAPDGMHLVISILLIAAMISGIVAIRGWKRQTASVTF